MKRFTLMALSALVVCGMASAAARPAKSKARAKAVAVAAHKPAAAQEKAPWLPLKQSDFDWEYDDETNPSDGRWVAGDVYDITYTPEGKVATEVTTTPDGEMLKDVYTYNADGMLASQITSKSTDGGATYLISQERYCQYDNVVKDFVVSNEQYIYVGGKR